MTESKRPLVVYGITLSVYSDDEVLKHYPDAHRCRQINAIVATRTKKEAIALFGVSASEARDFMGETGNEKALSTALAKPGQVFARPIDEYHGDYFEITRTPHTPTPRRPKQPYVAYVAPPRFTKEELQEIIERFEMANSEIGQKIADKAKKMMRGV